MMSAWEKVGLGLWLSLNVVLGWVATYLFILIPVVVPGCVWVGSRRGRGAGTLNAQVAGFAVFVGVETLQWMRNDDPAVSYGPLSALVATDLAATAIALILITAGLLAKRLGARVSRA